MISFFYKFFLFFSGKFPMIQKLPYGCPFSLLGNLRLKSDKLMRNGQSKTHRLTCLFLLGQDIFLCLKISKPSFLRKLPFSLSVIACGQCETYKQVLEISKTHFLDCQHSLSTNSWNIDDPKCWIWRYKYGMSEGVGF